MAVNKSSGTRKNLRNESPVSRRRAMQLAHVASGVDRDHEYRMAAVLLSLSIHVFEKKVGTTAEAVTVIAIKSRESVG